MEKVIVANCWDEIHNYDVNEVNEYLAKGWKVKFIKLHNTKDSIGSTRINAIFVLEQ